MRGSTLLYFQNVTFPKFFYVLIMREKIGDFSEFKAYCFIQRFVWRERREREKKFSTEFEAYFLENVSLGS